MLRQHLQAVCAAVALTISAPVLAAWPDDQNIELVVGFAPGGGTDLMARAMAPFMEKKLGGRARIVVVNKPGASGEISSTYIARAKPDGYTIGFINVPGFVFSPMHKSTSYQVSDLRIIARVVDDPSVLMSRKDAKFLTLDAIVAELKKNPGSLTFANSGRGTSGHLSLLAIEQVTGVKGTDVAYKGAGEFKSALLGGHVDYAFASVGEYLAAKNDAVGAIAVLSQKRFDDLGPVPTATELGVKALVSSERGIAGPKALPDDIANRIQNAIKDTLQDPAFIKTVKNDAAVLAYLPGAEWTQTLDGIREWLKPFVNKMKD
jgi:tripartite-type tricarboxylate transporter receptor subunit TctC